MKEQTLLMKEKKKRERIQAHRNKKFVSDSQKPFQRKEMEASVQFIAQSLLIP